MNSHNWHPSQGDYKTDGNEKKETERHKLVEKILAFFLIFMTLAVLVIAFYVY